MRLLITGHHVGRTSTTAVCRSLRAPPPFPCVVVSTVRAGEHLVNDCAALAACTVAEQGMHGTKNERIRAQHELVAYDCVAFAVIAADTELRAGWAEGLNATARRGACIAGHCLVVRRALNHVNHKAVYNLNCYRRVRMPAILTDAFDLEFTAALLDHGESVLCEPRINSYARPHEADWLRRKSWHGTDRVVGWWGNVSYT